MIAPCQAVRLWLIVIGGFTQSSDGTTSHGCTRLRDRLDKRFPAADVQVILVAWNADMRALAERIGNESGPEVRIILCAYSWGCGRGARLLAHYLEDRGLAVDCLVSSDGVAHTVWLWSRIRALIPARRPLFTAFTRWDSLLSRLRTLAWSLGRLMPSLVPSVILPWNVRSVIAFRQSRNVPMGHSIGIGRRGIEHDTATVKYLRANVNHEAMDDLTAWHDACERVAVEAAGAAA